MTDPDPDLECTSTSQKCLRCRKSFDSSRALNNHLGHPSSAKCRASYKSALPPSSSHPPTNNTNLESQNIVPDIVLGHDSLEYEEEVIVEDADSGEWFGFEDGPENASDTSSSAFGEATLDKPVFDIHPAAGATFGTTQNSLEQVESNRTYSENCGDNICYPFASEAEVQVAAWLDSASISMGEIDKFLRLELVSYVTEFIKWSSHRSVKGEKYAIILHVRRRS